MSVLREDGDREVIVIVTLSNHHVSAGKTNKTALKSKV